MQKLPFSNHWDADLFYPAEQAQNARLKGRYFFESKYPLILLTGDSGTGKTVVSYLLKEETKDQENLVLSLPFPTLPPSEITTYLAAQILRATSCGEAIIHLNQAQALSIVEEALISVASTGKRALLLIDDAHLLTEKHLLLLQQFLHLTSEGNPLLSLLLLGNNDLPSLLHQIPTLRERAVLAGQLAPLSLGESAAYIDYRLSEAKAPQNPFTIKAMEALYYHSGGIPRKLNQLADLALFTGYAQGLKVVDYDQIEAISQELTIQS